MSRKVARRPRLNYGVRNQMRSKRPREVQQSEPTMPPCTSGRLCSVWLPIKTTSTANERGSTRWRGARDAAIRGKAATIARAYFAQYRVKPPCTIVLTRMSERELDSDNAASALKRCRDGIADALGIDDRDPRVVWVVAQAKSKTAGVLVEVYEPGSSASALASLDEDWLRANAHALDVILPLLRASR